MAILIPPTKVYRVGRKKKWHFPALRQSDTDQRLLQMLYGNDVSDELVNSVCKLLLWRENEEFEEADVADVPAADICKRCLGPMNVRD